MVFSEIYVKKKEIKIQCFQTDFNGAWVENHLHMSSSDQIAICHQMSLLVVPIAPKTCIWRSTRLIHICNQNFSQSTRGIEALTKPAMCVMTMRSSL